MTGETFAIDSVGRGRVEVHLLTTFEVAQDRRLRQGKVEFLRVEDPDQDDLVMAGSKVGKRLKDRFQRHQKIRKDADKELDYPHQQDQRRKY